MSVDVQIGKLLKEKGTWDMYEQCTNFSEKIADIVKWRHTSEVGIFAGGIWGMLKGHGNFGGF